MYYNIEFVKDFETNHIVFVFHNEVTDIEKNIVSPMTELLIPALEKKYCAERSNDEFLLCLRYPNEKASEKDFNLFFDSPELCAFYRKQFAGVFIIDASHYSSICNRIEDLIQYIKAFASESFCFICLFNSRIKNQIDKTLKEQEYEDVFIKQLMLDDSAVDTLAKKIDDAAYDKLREGLSSPIAREKSYGYVNDVIDNVLTNDESVEKAMAKLMVKNINSERGIGF